MSCKFCNGSGQLFADIYEQRINGRGLWLENFVFKCICERGVSLTLPGKDKEGKDIRIPCPYPQFCKAYNDQGYIPRASGRDYEKYREMKLKDIRGET